MKNVHISNTCCPQTWAIRKISICSSLSFVSLKRVMELIIPDIGVLISEVQLIRNWIPWLMVAKNLDFTSKASSSWAVRAFTCCSRLFSRFFLERYHEQSFVLHLSNICTQVKEPISVVMLYTNPPIFVLIFVCNFKLNWSLRCFTLTIFLDPIFLLCIAEPNDAYIWVNGDNFMYLSVFP